MQLGIRLHDIKKAPLEERLAIAQGEEANGRLLSRAVGGEKVFVDGETYPAEELLTLYLKN